MSETGLMKAPTLASTRYILHPPFQHHRLAAPLGSRSWVSERISKSASLHMLHETPITSRLAKFYGLQFTKDTESSVNDFLESVTRAEIKYPSYTWVSMSSMRFRLTSSKNIYEGGYLNGCQYLIVRQRLCMLMISADERIVECVETNMQVLDN